MRRFLTLNYPHQGAKSVAGFFTLFLAASEVLSGAADMNLTAYAKEVAEPDRAEQRTIVPSNPVVSKDFYTQLTPVEREIYTELETSIYDGKASIDLSSLTSVYTTTLSSAPLDKSIQRSVNKAFDALRYDNPDYFWLSKININEVETELDITGKVAITKVDLALVNSTVSVMSEKAASDAAMQKMMQSVSGNSRKEQLESLYTSVGLWMTYNYGLAGKSYSSPEIQRSQHVTSALLDRYTVCTGYAKTFKLGADALGIPAVLVSGMGYNGSSAEVHMWVMVQMEDGKWYAVDPTWDDVGDGTIRDDYFLAGSNTIVPGGKSFEDTHKPDRGLFSSGDYGFSYPTLSSSRYDSPKGRIYPK